MTPLVLIVLSLLFPAPGFAQIAGKGHTLPAGAQPEVDGQALEDTYWRLSQLGEAEPEFAENAREPHLLFLPGGSISGADGCNTFRGSYVRTGESLKIGPLMGTLMACPGLGKLDRRFLDALGATRQWAASASELTLFDATGQAVARFDAVHR